MEEMRGVEGGGGGEKGLARGVWRRSRLVDGGGRGGTIEFQRILKREIVETRGIGLVVVEALLSSSRSMVESGDDVFPAALCTREGAVAPLGLHARAGRRGGEAVRERGRRL